MQIHLYALCLDEIAMLPFFFRHYRGIVDRFYIYDNGSTDGSIEFMRDQENVEVTSFVTHGDSLEDYARNLHDQRWKESRGAADWVIICDIDEHLHHPDLRRHLSNCSASGVTAVRATGYHMISADFPPADAFLPKLITRGARAHDFDKLAIFNPNAITATNFELGRHSEALTGEVHLDTPGQVLLLHYKRLGVEYVVARKRRLAQTLRSRDIAMGWGRHNLVTEEEAREAFARQLGEAEEVQFLPRAAPTLDVL